MNLTKKELIKVVAFMKSRGFKEASNEEFLMNRDFSIGGLRVSRNRYSSKDSFNIYLFDNKVTTTIQVAAWLWNELSFIKNEEIGMIASLKEEFLRKGLSSII